MRARARALFPVPVPIKFNTCTVKEPLQPTGFLPQPGGATEYISFHLCFPGFSVRLKACTVEGINRGQQPEAEGAIMGFRWAHL